MSHLTKEYKVIAAFDFLDLVAFQVCQTIFEQGATIFLQLQSWPHPMMQ